MNDYDLDILRLAGQGYCCAQIVIKLALDMQGCENKQLIKAMSALCHGFPGHQGACGALNGAACLIGMYAGKGGPDEEEDKNLLMLSELDDWFRQYLASELQTTGIACGEIVPDGELNTQVCGNLISACYGQAITLLVNHGFDLSAPCTE
jgi:hypothetical protein